MRLLVAAVLLASACATQGDINRSVRAAQWCEQNYPGRCEAYWRVVDRNVDSRDRGQRLGDAARAYQTANAAAAPVNPYQAPPPTARTNVSCTSYTVGNTVQTYCN